MFRLTYHLIAALARLAMRSGRSKDLEIQSVLANRGQHRAPSIPDLLIAATAELADLTVLHLDEDFELIAQITGQPVERLNIL